MRDRERTRKQRAGLAVIFLTIGMFVLHGTLGLDTATCALSGAGLLLLITYTRNEAMIGKVLSKVEWLAIFFFAGLFVLVGALVETGVIKMLAAEAIKITNGSVNATAMLILWMSAIASAFIDNIPFVATLIPLIKDMGQMGLTNLSPPSSPFLSDGSSSSSSSSAFASACSCIRVCSIAEKRSLPSYLPAFHISRRRISTT